MASNFTDQLMTFRRKAQLSGRPATSDEVSGIAQGYAAEATNRLNAAKTVEQNQQQIDLAKQREKDMKRYANAQMAMDEKNRTESLLMTGGGLLLGTDLGRGLVGATVGGVGDIVGGMYNAATGAGISGITSGVSNAVEGFSDVVKEATWLCNETAKHVEVDQDEWSFLKAFRQYARNNHPVCFDFYMRIGKELAEKITEKEGKLAWFKIRDELAIPVIEHFVKNRIEAAFIHYREYTRKLIEKYMKNIYPATVKVIEADKELYSNMTFKKVAA